MTILTHHCGVLDADGDPHQTSSSASSGGAGGTGDAFASAGIIKVFASMFSPAGSVVGSGSADGRYSEDITISSAGFNGTAAQIQTSVTVQGFIDPQGSGGGNVIFAFGLGSVNQVFNGGWTANSTNPASGGFPSEFASVSPGGTLFYSGIHDFTFDIIIGTSFKIFESLTASTFKIDCQFGGNCQQSAQGSVDIDFGHSSYWNGISAISLKDPNTGNFIPAERNLFSVSSTSGVDWFTSLVPAPVPVPTAFWLFGSALVGASGWLRRRAT